MTSEITPITCQGLFTWTGSEYRRLKNIGYKKFTRDRRAFYALNVPNVAELTNLQAANSMIITTLLDSGLESPYIILDPQNISGGVMMPATDEESTNNPGMCVWVGAIEIPRLARFSEPNLVLKDGKLVEIEDTQPHNITMEAALRNLQTEVGSRVFDAEHGGFVQEYTFNIVDDRNGPDYIPPSWIPKNVG